MCSCSCQTVVHTPMCVTKPWFSKQARKWMLSSILFTGDGLGSIFPVWDLRFWESHFAGWRWKSEMLGPPFFFLLILSFAKVSVNPRALGEWAAVGREAGWWKQQQKVKKIKTVGASYKSSPSKAPGVNLETRGGQVQPSVTPEKDVLGSLWPEWAVYAGLGKSDEVEGRKAQA